eukprot:11533702-Alexandrium_andersonii.AAC.1
MQCGVVALLGLPAAALIWGVHGVAVTRVRQRAASARPGPVVVSLSGGSASVQSGEAEVPYTRRWRGTEEVGAFRGCRASGDGGAAQTLAARAAASSRRGSM